MGKLEETLQVERGDIGRPPQVNGRAPDCVLCSTHYGLYDNGIPNGAFSIHRHAGEELREWIDEHVVQPAIAMHKQWEEAGMAVNEYDGWVRFGDVRLCPGGNLRAYHYFGDAIQPVEGSDGAIPHVIFGVGPGPTKHGRMSLGYCKELITSIHRRAFEEMDRHLLDTMVMASIGTGFGGTPLDASAKIAMEETATWLASRHCDPRLAEKDASCKSTKAAITALCYEPEAYDAFLAGRQDVLKKCLMFLQDPDKPTPEHILPPCPDIERADGAHLAGMQPETPAHCRQS